MTLTPCEGDVVAITGAGRGLGRAYALDAARAGAHLVLNDLDQTTLNETASLADGFGARVELVPGPVQDPRTGRRIVTAAVTRFGRLSGLVNNAGIRTEGAAWDEHPELVCRVIDVNLTGAIMCGIPALNQMRSQGFGSVINVSSRAQSGIHESATYSATKGALASLTYSWAMDMRPHGVRVNAIAPQAGGTGTRRLSTTGPNDPCPEQISPLVVYLLSSRSRHVTGQVVRFGLPIEEGIGLALMSHPRQLRAETRPSWTVDTIATHFTGALADALEPLGADWSER